MGAVIAAAGGVSSLTNPCLIKYGAASTSSSSGFSFFGNSSTANVTGLIEGGPSGTVKKSGKPRARPYVTKRNLRAVEDSGKKWSPGEVIVKPSVNAEKRKEFEVATSGGKVARQKTFETVPSEGPSSS